jgi:phosphocarrier protein
MSTKPASLFVEKTAIPNLQSTSKLEVISELVDCLVGAGSVPAAKREALVKAMKEREKLGSTGVGGGVAIPHVKLDFLKATSRSRRRLARRHQLRRGGRRAGARGVHDRVADRQGHRASRRPAVDLPPRAPSRLRSLHEATTEPGEILGSWKSWAERRRDAHVMTISHRIKLVNRQGLHARPIQRIVEVCRRHQSKIRIARGVDEVDGRSILEMLTLAAPRGTELMLTAEGDDEQSLIAEL